MEILDQLQAKVRNAVQKIEELQAKVKELEDIKLQYEEKMQSLVREIGDLGPSSSDSQVTEESNSNDQQEEDQENSYRHQF